MFIHNIILFFINFFYSIIYFFPCCIISIKISYKFFNSLIYIVISSLILYILFNLPLYASLITFISSESSISLNYSLITLNDKFSILSLYISLVPYKLLENNQVHINYHPLKSNLLLIYLKLFPVLPLILLSFI